MVTPKNNPLAIPRSEQQSHFAALILGGYFQCQAVIINRNRPLAVIRMLLRFITTVLKGLKKQITGIKNRWFFHENRRFFHDNCQFFKGFKISTKGTGGVFFAF
jgi:hypothetical protein